MTKLSDQALNAHAALNALETITQNTPEAHRLLGLVRAGLPELPEGTTVAAAQPAKTDHELAQDLRVAETERARAEAEAAVPEVVEAPIDPAGEGMTAGAPPGEAPPVPVDAVPAEETPTDEATSEETTATPSKKGGAKE